MLRHAPTRPSRTFLLYAAPQAGSIGLDTTARGHHTGARQGCEAERPFDSHNQTTRETP